MKIDSSAVTMSSNHSYYSHLEQHSEQLITTSEKAATLEFSDESKSLVEQMREYKKELAGKSKEDQENAKKNIAELILARKDKKQSVENSGTRVKSEKEIHLEAMRRILELLNAMRKGGTRSLGTLTSTLGEVKQLSKDLNSSEGSEAPQIGISEKTGSFPETSGASVPRRTTWKKITVTSAFYTEAEHTAYRTQGFAKTADGREINFNIDVEMSRAFCDKYESCMQESYVCVDPLVINLDSNIGSVSDQKFMFDLDSDGKEEEISFVEKGSGFLALDKNGDGKINDGSELFGTKSGDGFADLAKYDEDGNGWIDESDAVFNDLRIWTKNEDGEDVLLSLKEADVGAIYLGKASTQFSLQNEEHHTNGIIRSTGVYLKESGGAGTVQHIDLTL